MSTFHEILDAAMQLSTEQKEMLVQILRMRRIEERRAEIAAHANEALRAFHADELKNETVEDLLARLHGADQP